MRRIKNLLKKGTSLMLTVAMLMGLCATGFATGIGQSHAVPQNAKKYVSLGDSMANGYGLDGYEVDGKEVNGYLMHAMQSYPCQFAEGRFEHIPMAISAMRAEDLHFILEFPYENAEALAVAEMKEWDEADWTAMFSTGDYYTWDEFTTNRFHDYGDYGHPELSGTANVAEKFQTEVANADIISLGIGNANFGVFLLGRVFEAMSIMGDKPEDAKWYQLERALAECDEETRAFVLSVYDELTAKIGDTEQAQTLVRVLTYGVLSYVLNYAGVIERIVELNPDAEIMLVGLINTMYGMKITGDFGEVDLGQVLGSLIGTMNTYLAALPAAFQLAGKYEDATFYYAEASDVELIYTEMADAAEVNFEGYEIVRDRIVTEVCENMVFPMVNGVIQEMAKAGKLPEGLTFEMLALDGGEEGFNLKRVTEFETNPAENHTDAINYVIYRAFEIAIIEASKLDVLDINSLTALAGGLESVFAGVSGAFMPAIEAGAYMKLGFVEANLEDAEGVAVQLAAALTEDETIVGLLHLFARMMIGNGIGAHPTADGHDTIADAVIKAYNEKNTVDQEVINRITATLNDVATIIAENYEEAYAYGYQYALENGYIDAAFEALEIAYNELESIKVLVEANSDKMSAEFYAELTKEIAQAQNAIVELAELIETADVLDNETLVAALDLVAALEKNLATILNLLDIAIDDVSAAVYAELKARVEALNAYVENEVLPAIDKAIREAHDYAVAYLRNLADKAYAAFVAAVEKAYEQYGIAKEQICKYLTEKADEIIALIIAYGHGVEEKIANFLYENREEIAALLIELGEEYGPVVLEALLEIAVKYGPEAAEWTYEFLLNNPDKVIAFVSEYGPYAEPYLPYAVAVLGFVWVNFGDEIVDFVIANRCEILTVMVELVKEYGDEAWALIKVYVDELGLTEKLPGEVTTYLNKLAELLVKYGMDMIEKYDVIGKLEAAVAELREAIEAQIDAQIEAAIARVEAAIAELKALVENQINMTIEQFQAAVEAAIAELNAAVVELIEAAQNKGEELVNAAVAQFVKQIKVAYMNATHGEYVMGEDSYYVAIGDSYVSDYAGLLAAELGLGENYMDLTADSMAAIIENLFEAENLAAIANADFITVGYSNNSILNFAVMQLQSFLKPDMTPVEMDWTAALGEDGAEYVAAALAEIRAELVAQGLDNTVALGMLKVNMADLMMLLVESYAYASVDYVRNYPVLIESIRAINEDALIVSVGMSNTMSDIELTFDALNEFVGSNVIEMEEIAIGEYVQYLVDAANAEALSLAMLAGETVYVDASAVDTVADEDAYDSVIVFLMEGILGQPDEYGIFGYSGYGLLKDGLAASEEGNAYIAEQILNALTVSKEEIEEPEVPDVKKGDVNGDGKVNGRDTIIIATAIANKTTQEFTAEEFAAADVNGDGKINGRDTIIIATAIANKTTDEL